MANKLIQHNADELAPQQHRPKEVSRGDIFEVLRNERRQLVLEYFKQHGDDGADLREIVDFVAAKENGTTVGELDSDARKRVYAALRQSHLPKMHDIGVIEYERLRGDVAINEASRDVQAYLDYVPSDGLTPSYYYLGLTTICSLLVLFYLLGVFPLAAVSEMGLMILILVLFAIGSVARPGYALLQ